MLYQTDKEKEAKEKTKRLVIKLVAVGVLIFGCIASCIVFTALAPPPEAPVTTRTPRTEGISLPTPTATVVPVGTSRQNPVPLNHTMVGGGMDLAIVEVLRPADLLIAEANRFNDSPDPGNEYVAINILALCTLSPEDDEQCHLQPYEFELTGSSNLVREREWVSDVPEMLNDTEFYSGGVVSGVLVFQVAQGEENLILIYEPFWSFLFENEVFFALQ